MSALNTAAAAAEAGGEGAAAAVVRAWRCLPTWLGWFGVRCVETICYVDADD